MPRPRVVNVQLPPEEEIFYSEYAISILAEGDSWFAWSQLNLVPSSNILEQLDFDEKALVVNYAYSGDTIRRMSSFFDNGAFFIEMRSQPYNAILLSGGGNDVIDALYDYQADSPLIIKRSDDGHGDDPNSYVDVDALNALCAYVTANFQQIFNYRTQGPAANKHTPIILHTYDYMTPRDAPALFMHNRARGPWLFRALMQVGAPSALYQDIAKIIIDTLAETLLNLANPAELIYVVDTRGLLTPAVPGTTAHSNDWINEIHPDTSGYTRLAWRIGEELERIGVVV